MTLIISQDDACTLASLIKHVNGFENTNGNSPAVFFKITDTQDLILELKAKPGPQGNTAIYVREKVKASSKKAYVVFKGNTCETGIDFPPYTSEMVIYWNHVPGLPPEMERAPLILEVS